MNARTAPRAQIAVATLFLTLMVPSFLPALARYQNQPETPPEVNVRGPVATVEAEMVVRNSGERRKPLATARFDRDERLQTREAYQDGQFQWRSTFEYDDNGLLIAWRSSSESGIMQWEYQYSYDEYGRLEREVSYDSANEIDGIQTYEHDGVSLLEEAMYSGAGTLQWSRTYSYDANLLHREWTLIYPDGGPVKTTREYFDRFGRLVREVHLDEVSQEGEIFRHDYDAAGRLVRTRVETASGDPIRSVNRRYNNHGDLVAEERNEYGEDLRSVRQFEYRYDSAGNWTVRVETDRAWQDDEEFRHERERIERAISYY